MHILVTLAISCSRSERLEKSVYNTVRDRMTTREKRINQRNKLAIGYIEGCNARVKAKMKKRRKEIPSPFDYSPSITPST